MRLTEKDRAHIRKLINYGLPMSRIVERTGFDRKTIKAAVDKSRV